MSCITFVYTEEPGRNPRLPCTPDIAAVARSCRFALYNIHRILVQALVISCLDYSSSLLSGLSASDTEPLKCIQNAAALRLQSTQTLPCDPPPPWPPLTSCWGPHPIPDDGAGLQGRQQVYVQTLVRPLTPERALHSSTSRRVQCCWYHRWEQTELLREVTTLLCSGASEVERTPDQRQDSRVNYARYISQRSYMSSWCFQS